MKKIIDSLNVLTTNYLLPYLFLDYVLPFIQQYESFFLDNSPENGLIPSQDNYLG